MTSSPQAVVLCGDGINCEVETVHGLTLAGFSARTLHTSELLSNPAALKEAQLLALPGGFSFGDEIASGKVLALKLKDRLKNAIYEFLDAGNQVIGICNGFQILVQLGILPDSSAQAKRTVSLCHNSGGHFIDRWVELDIDESNPSVFFSGLTSIWLPIRHGEGNLRLADDAPETTIDNVKKCAPLRYSEDVNGSFDRIAALTNEKGNCLGLMPHPEAFVRWSQHPSWTNWRYTRSDELEATPHGLYILKNAARVHS